MNDLFRPDMPPEELYGKLKAIEKQRLAILRETAIKEDPTYDVLKNIENILLEMQKTEEKSYEILKRLESRFSENK